MVFIAIAIGKQAPRLRCRPSHVRSHVRGAAFACVAGGQRRATRNGQRQFGRKSVARVQRRCLHYGRLPRARFALLSERRAKGRSGRPSKIDWFFDLGKKKAPIWSGLSNSARVSRSYPSLRVQGLELIEYLNHRVALRDAGDVLKFCGIDLSFLPVFYLGLKGVHHSFGVGADRHWCPFTL